MIDIENKVITLIDQAFKTAEKTVKVASVYIPEPSNFPFCYIEQTGNSTYTKSLDGSLKEHHARVAFSMAVFSKSVSEAKELAQIVDETMQNIKFTRTDYDFFQEDAFTTRVVLRYSAIVEEGKEVGNDTVYQIYR